MNEEIEVTLYLSDAYPITIRAKDTTELVHIIMEYDRRNLVVMLAQAIRQLSKRDRQLEALGVLSEKLQ